jgi:tetratricopeptide (TPR) repeat protein
MAFGFGFNKQKALSAAEKFVQQGKLQNAINEYDKILKADPKDLTVLNTVGDLYARLGQNDNAIQCFKSVGDAYAGQGFTVKAIAMYKKLTKLKPSVEAVLRLAELYTQQGLFNDSRAQYLQVAEEFLRAGELNQAVRIFQKTLEMDPENVAMRTRLAEVYVRLGKKTEAWEIFSTAAESLRARGSMGAAGEIIQRMLALDPTNSNALLLRGRLAYDSGNIASAVRDLESVADLDNHPDGLHTLFQAYLRTGRLTDAGTLASKLASVHNDVTAATAYAEALVEAGRFEDALQIYQDYSDRLLAADAPKVLDSLHGIIGHVRENPEALENLLALLQKAGDQSHLTEVYELLGHAYVQFGELEKARDYYFKLTQLEPQNQLHARNYQQMVQRLGTPGPGENLITVEEGANLVEELEATAPFLEQRHPDDVALAVRAALTDAELFLSYNMPAKALDPLQSALPKAPRDLRLNQRLAALHTRLGQFREAAVCARTLEEIYSEASYPEEATRYAELAGRYEERAAHAEAHPEPIVEAVVETSTAEEPAAEQAAQAVEEFTVPIETPEFTADTAAPAPAAPKRSGLFWHAPLSVSATPAHEPSAPRKTHMEPIAETEIDLSQEWESATLEEPEAVAPEKTASAPKSKSARNVQDPETREAIKETTDEVRFYLKHSMVDQAETALDKLERLKADRATLSAVRAQIEAAKAAAAETADEISAESEADIEEIEIEDTAEIQASIPQISLPHVAPAASRPTISQHAPQSKTASELEDVGGLGDFVADLESSLGDGFLGAPAAGGKEGLSPAISRAPAVPGTRKPAGIPAHSSGAAAAAAPALEPQAPFAVSAQSAAAGPAADAEAGVDLSDMFTDLKRELDEDTAVSAEDPETHYNLGVAFREMGLLDEAISELQKVCQAVEHGHSFAHKIQAYTWLAQCFLDKGVPEVAIRWYESALKLPGLDADTAMALHYELGSSQEAAQNKPAALKHFMQVYGSNIDYRDVAERIRALRS